MNKAVMSEVNKTKSVYDSPRLPESFQFDSKEWLIHNLQLAKLPTQSIKAVKHLTTQWCAIIHMVGENETTTSDVIEFLKGIFLTSIWLPLGQLWAILKEAASLN